MIAPAITPSSLAFTRRPTRSVDGSTARRVAPTRANVLAVHDDRRNRRIAAGVREHALALRSIVLRVVDDVLDPASVVIGTRFRAIRTLRRHVEFEPLVRSAVLVLRPRHY